MKRILILTVLLLLSSHSSLHAAVDTSQKIVWAFPITTYSATPTPGTQVVQVTLPAHVRFVKDKQIGLLRGVALGRDIDTATKGTGWCHFVKGADYYFAITMYPNAKRPKAGDLIYTQMPAAVLDHTSYTLYCAANNITLTTLTGTPFYKPLDFLKKRTRQQDDLLDKKMLDDIHATGKYFLKADTSQNQPVQEGGYKGRRILDIMIGAEQKDLSTFLQFVAASPRIYAGHTWKLPEVFVAWVTRGAPVMVEQE